MSVTHGQCDARPTVPSQPQGITAQWLVSYDTVVKRHICVNNLPSGRLGFEPTTYELQIQHPTAMPQSHCIEKLFNSAVFINIFNQKSQLELKQNLICQMPFLTWHPYCYICIIPITSQKTYTWLITLGFSDQQQMGKLSHYRSDWQMHWSETQISSKTTCSQRTQKYELQLRVNTASRQQFHGWKFTLLKLTDTIWLQSHIFPETQWCRVYCN